MGVLRDLAYEYLAPITATNGQSGGFIVTDIVPLLRDQRRVLYIGDYELRGPADQIEANTKRYIEEHTGRTFGAGEWTKIALTEKQVKASNGSSGSRSPSSISATSQPRPYEAIECEALGQGVLVRIIRKHLDRLLPEPLADVLVREEAQQANVRAALLKVARRLR